MFDFLKKRDLMTKFRIRPDAVEFRKEFPIRDYSEEIEKSKGILNDMGIHEVKPVTRIGELKENDKRV